MKKIYKNLMLPILLFFCTMGIKAQQPAGNYAFSETTETYTSVVGTVSTAIGDEGDENSIALPISFKFEGVTYTTFSISTNGFIRLGAPIGPTAFANFFSNTAAQRPLISPLWDDNNRGTGSIQYAVSGVAPNRVFEIGWDNVNIGAGGGTSASLFASYKIRLNETTDVIEFIYGPTMNKVGNVTASVGINGTATFLSVTPAASSTASNTTANNSINSTTNLVGKKFIFTPSAAATCSAPSALTAYNITQTSAMLDWTENGTATEWDIEWGFQGFTLGAGTPVHVAAKPYLLNGLMPNTSYSYYVRADCGGGDTSLWVGPFVFATPPCMPMTIDLGVDTTLCSSMSITLDAGVTGSYGYTWSTTESTQTIVVDTAKTGGNGTFNISVMIIDFSTMCTYNDDINITFTNCVGLEENTVNPGYSIYPNPTNGLFTVQNVTGKKVTIEVLNIQGKVVYKNSLSSSSQKIDLTDNGKGLYFVNITSDKGVEIYKIIVQ